MASQDGTTGGPLRKYAGLDEHELRQVLALVEGTDVLELEVAFGSGRLALRRPAVGAAGWTGTAATLPAAQHDHPGPEPPLAITSPLVGIFRPSVRPGDQVAEGQPLGAIEALGMPTSVDAPQGGTVEEVLVADGSPVEYGQPLLVLKRAERDHRP